ncbi:DIL domain-containing protein [Amylocystis lapponica]|nr:DIL domain-containing protein [Amylocystis lapponica]
MASSSVPSVDFTVEPDLQPIYPTPSHTAHLLSPNVSLSPSQKAELVSHAYVDLAKQDEDGLCLISITILGFGSESERDLEREECVRLLVSEGCDVNVADKAGWTPLHYASLLAPPTLISHLLTHGSLPLLLTRRKLTALDIVTAHSTVPGREDVALLLEEAMREEASSALEQRIRRLGKRKSVQDDIEKVLGSAQMTPPPDYTSMLVFAPYALPDIFQSLITDFKPSLRNAEPANALYMLARFACLTCATDTIEETFFNQAEDAACLVFWLYNTTLWLHLMRCDNAISAKCETLEILNSVFVFIIRLAERKIDKLLDGALLDYCPLSTEFDSIQFESEWSFLRSLPTRKSFASLRQTLTRARAPSATVPLQSLFTDPVHPQPITSPRDITAFMTALHTPHAFWHQSSIISNYGETFNRVLTRKKYICRSRAVQISMNLSVLEEWVGEMQLPRGVVSHFAPVRDLLTWLQGLSSIVEFPNLIATIQSLRNLNPLQMRRAVRDYRYEVSETHMTEECNQYLAQLQKDWERHRVKLGVEALRKEIGERERDREESASVSPSLQDVSIASDSVSMVPSQETSAAQRGIDGLFDRSLEKSFWEPAKAPEPLGELLDSRFMLPLLLPSDPRMLGAFPVKRHAPEEDKWNAARLSLDSASRSASRASFGSRGAMAWRLDSKKLRDVGVGTLEWVDGSRAASRWTRPVEADEEDAEKSRPPPYTSDDSNPLYGELGVATHFTPLTRQPSTRSRGRASVGEFATPVEPDRDDISAA